MLPSKRALTPLIGSEAETSRRFFYTDGLGSVIATLDETGAVTKKYRYSPFGIHADTNDHSDQPWGYTGQRYDADSGLYYYKARYYHPSLGRFLSVDPVGYDDQMNLYAYVANRPMMFRDPSGRLSESLLNLSDGDYDLGGTTFGGLVDDLGSAVDYYAYSGAQQGNQTICYGGCNVFLTSVGGNVAVASGESGGFLVADPETGLAHSFTYVAGGVGLGTPLGIFSAGEVGLLSITTIDSLTGFGLSANAFAAARTGTTGQLFGDAAGTIGVTGGAVVGWGAGVSGLVTYSSYEGSYNYQNLPQNLIDQFGLD